MQWMTKPEPGTRTVTVLGMFDGVHRGHQALLLQGREKADELGIPLAVCTFEPHPLAVLRPELQPDRLTTRTERAQLMASYGVDLLCVNRFTREMAGEAPEAFVQDLVRDYHPAAVVCGFNFTFGDRGRGNAELLRQMSTALGYEACVVPEVVLGGATVSSTRIRGLLTEGKVREAAGLLGHAYTLTGTADEIGRDGASVMLGMAIGHRKALPAKGAYYAYLTADGVHHPCVVTVDGTRILRIRVLNAFFRADDEPVRITLMDNCPDADEAEDWFSRME